MKVNGSQDSVRLDLATGKPVAKSTAGAARATSDAARVSLSDGSATLAAGAASPEFDASKVAELKQAIRDGRFEVDSGVVADKLIANVNDLFGKPH
jgi:negative regulator of flagellin synthesis FlgM